MTTVSSSQPMIVAHRGANREAPENTQPAFDAALAHGVAGLEFDIQLTRDDIPIIYHDRTLTRIANDRRRISDFSLKELKKFDWGGWFGRAFHKEPLLTLDLMLALYSRRTHLFAEIKSHDRSRGRHKILTTIVLDSIRRLVPAEQMNDTFILSYDREVLSLAQREEPGLKYVLNIEAPSDFTGRRPPSTLRLFACCLPIRNLTASFAQKLHRQGLQVMTYSCNTSRQVAKARQAGVEVIMTDDPGWLIPFMKKRSRI